MAKRAGKTKKEVSWKWTALVIGILVSVYLLFYTNIISLITNSEIIMRFVIPIIVAMVIGALIVEINIGSIFDDSDWMWGLNIAVFGIISVVIYVLILFIFFPR